MNRDLLFCTIHGRSEVSQLAAILLVSDRLIANQLTEIFRLTGNIPSLSARTILPLWLVKVSDVFSIIVVVIIMFVY